jgi:S-adenosylmethionine:tRNA ribosyltransferase-isomerase
MSELELYQYTLPDELIAREPAEQRDAARLLLLHRKTGQIEHRIVRDLPELLHPGDLLILNDTRVLPARLVGRRAETGGRWEGLFLKTAESGLWEVIGQTRGKLQPGEDLLIPAVSHPKSATPESSSAAESQRTQNSAGDASAFASPSEQPLVDELRLKLVERLPEGGWLVRPQSAESHVALLERYGQIPLPPYMERDEATAADRERYQTLYARHPGSVAAPTAGLHFTSELLERCRQRGIETSEVTLHVGLGTFRPISAERLDDHVMHSEWCEVSAATVAAVQRTRAQGGRIVAIGTTSVRTLETASQTGTLQPFQGETRLFIRPPYQFHSVDVMLTNFHLPKSTLLVLLSAFAGREKLLAAYHEAVEHHYRFYSYGDAMLVL